MQKTLFIITFLASIFIMAGGGLTALAQVEAPQNNTEAGIRMESKILVTYFSHSGNTKSMAEQIQSIVGGDLFEIKTVTPYPDEYRPTTEVAKKEQESNARPELTAKVKQMASYDMIFLGFPNWWGTMPMPLFTFLEEYDFSGKKIALFCTHEGSRLGRSENDLKRLAPQASILKGFEVRGSRVDSARPQLQSWLKELGFSQ